MTAQLHEIKECSKELLGVCERRNLLAQKMFSYSL